MSKVTAHFVTFFSPGTFVPETTEKPVEAWDPEIAMRMARKIKERYNATPYAFRFSTRARNDDELDSKEIAHSPLYYLGGTIRTAKEVLSGTDPREDILRSNVRGNKIKRIITNDNSWRFTGELNDEDIVLDFKPGAKP